MKIRFSLFAAPLLLAMTALAAQGIETSEYGKMPDGRSVKLFTLTNAHGMVAKVTEYGAILVSLETPDRNGRIADVTHGYDSLEGWLGNTAYFGATVGRFANRIAGGKFSIDGTEFTLATNNAPGDMPCALHGGEVGFDKVLWRGVTFETKTSRGVALAYVSADGEEGYPGELRTTVAYVLTDDNELIWSAEATTDKPTVLNLVHHSYWNLSGDPSTSINDHLLQLNATTYLPTTKGLIPTGEKAPVAGTPMDFTQPFVIGARIDEAFEALEFGGGYDHCWIVDGSGLRSHAVLHDPKTGRTMEVLSDQPGIQFYGGNFLDGATIGKGGVAYQKRSALCLETENFPDAPNQESFPTAVLRPGQTYRHLMIHRFSAK